MVKKNRNRVRQQIEEGKRDNVDWQWENWYCKKWQQNYVWAIMLALPKIRMPNFNLLYSPRTNINYYYLAFVVTALLLFHLLCLSFAYLRFSRLFAMLLSFRTHLSLFTVNIDWSNELTPALPNSVYIM